MVSWPSGLRRYVQVVFLVGVGSNPTDTIHFLFFFLPTHLFSVFVSPIVAAKPDFCESIITFSSDLTYLYAIASLIAHSQ